MIQPVFCPRRRLGCRMTFGMMTARSGGAAPLWGSRSRNPTEFRFSVHQSPFYPGTGNAEERGEGKGVESTRNVPLPARSGDAEHKRAFEDKLNPAADAFKPDFVPISAGFAAAQDDRLRQMKLTPAGCAALTGIGVELPMVGLAKQFEEIIRDGQPVLRLPRDSNALRVITGLRDEAHRFAISYHRRLRSQRIRESALDEIPTIGKKKKELLLKHFGSFERLRKASLDELCAAPGVGPKTAILIHNRLNLR